MVDARDLVGATTRPSERVDFHHTGPGTLAGRFIRTFWQPIWRSEDLPKGRAMPIRVLGEDLTLYRGHSGVPYLVAYRCAHRGTQLSAGWVEEDCIRCFYHGWKYDGSGQCVEQPGEPRPFPDKVKILSYPVRDYLGAIFAYMGEGEPPPLHYPRYENVSGFIRVYIHLRACNYFNNVENTVDPIHLKFVHDARRGLEDWKDGPPVIRATETEWGLSCSQKNPDGSEGTSEFIMPDIHGGFSGRGRGSRHSDVGKGDLTLTGRETFRMIWKVPRDDESHYHIKIAAVVVPAEERAKYEEAWRQRPQRIDTVVPLTAAILRGEKTLDDVDLSDVYQQDIDNLVDDVAQVGQGIIGPDPDHELLGNSDNAVALLRRIWAREMRALSEGKPLKKWTTENLEIV